LKLIDSKDSDDKEREREEQIVQEEEKAAFWDRGCEISLMAKDIFFNAVPMSQQPDIIRKLEVLNYALGEWNDECERRFPPPPPNHHNDQHQSQSRKKKADIETTRTKAMTGRSSTSSCV
jgi:hypothetical protein